MSDMPRLISPLPASNHARHDGALVAQLAAGDSLDEVQQREAQRLVSACAACAQLADDLRTLAAAVALEPVPPRRRDFRLDAAQAERLGGNAVSRLLRRLSLPQSRAFGPAAAGLFSVGLVFVVAGYAWPGDGGVSVSREPEDPPAAVELFQASPMLEQGVPPASGGDSVSDEVEAFMVEKSTAAEGSPSDPAGEAQLRFSADSADSADSAELTAPSAPDAMAGADVDSVAPASAGEERSPVDAWLIVIGFGLAIVGGLLSVLAWLARRVADPLLR